MATVPCLELQLEMVGKEPEIRTRMLLKLRLLRAPPKHLSFSMEVENDFCHTALCMSCYHGRAAYSIWLRALGGTYQAS
jgi:hypothetical protein